MAQFWLSMDSTAKIVLIVTTACVLTGITGFVWYMVKKVKNKD